MPMRPDREDLTAQRDALEAARNAFADALGLLVIECTGPGLDNVADESRTLIKRLASHAKRPPVIDTDPWLGALSAADRHHTHPVRYDLRVGQARDAAYLLELAARDLASAAGVFA